MTFFQLSQSVEKVIKVILINLTLFLATIPFLAPIPINSDIQYPIFLVCGAIIFIDVLSKKFTLSKVEIYFVGLSILSFFYINPLLESNLRIPKIVGLLFAFLVFYVFKRYWRSMNPMYFKFGVYLNLVFILIEFIQIEFYFKIISPFVRLIKLDEGGSSRGFHGLMAEPSFLAGMGAFFFLIAIALLNEKRISRLSFLFLFIASFSMIILSSSITGVIFLVAILGLSLFLINISNFNKVLLIFLGIIFSFVLVIATIEIDIRGLDFLRDMIVNPTSVVNLTDRSISTRLMALIGAYESMISGHIFGNGVGSLQFVIFDLLRNSKIFGEYLGDHIYFATGYISAISHYIIELGLFFIVFLVWIYSQTRFISYAICIRAISLIYLLFSFSILFPPVWILLAITDKYNIKKITK